MKRTFLFTSALATAVALFAIGNVQAQEAATPTPPASGQPATAEIRWMTMADLIARLEGQGYRVMEVEREQNRYWEVKMTDANGMQVKAYLDPETGTPVQAMNRERAEYGDDGEDGEQHENRERGEDRNGDDD